MAVAISAGRLGDLAGLGHRSRAPHRRPAFSIQWRSTPPDNRRLPERATVLPAAAGSRSSARCSCPGSAPAPDLLPNDLVARAQSRTDGWTSSWTRARTSLAVVMPTSTSAGTTSATIQSLPTDHPAASPDRPGRVGRTPGREAAVRTNDGVCERGSRSFSAWPSSRSLTRSPRAPRGDALADRSVVDDRRHRVQTTPKRTLLRHAPHVLSCRLHAHRQGRNRLATTLCCWSPASRPRRLLLPRTSSPLVTVLARSRGFCSRT